MTTVQKHEETHDVDSHRELIKRIYFKGCSDEEVDVFLHICKRTGLDPMAKQIYPVPRWSSELKRNVMTPQTSIDGFRLIADRTGRYSPGRESTFSYNDKGELVSATSYIKKMTMDGTWHEVAATAFFDEYAQRTKDGKITQFWGTKGHIMLSKCAEAVAIRKGFPADLSNLYTADEMEQASNVVSSIPSVEYIDEKKVEEIENLLRNREELKVKLFEWASITQVSELPVTKYAGTIKAIQHHLEKEGVTDATEH